MISSAPRVAGLRLAGLLCLSVVLASANAWLNPHRPAWNLDVLAEGEIALTDAMAVGDTALWIDARPETQYRAGRIGGALPLNEDDWNGQIQRVLEQWRPGRRVIVYCSSQQCQASHDVARRLREEMGMEEVYTLKGGWEAWLAHQK
ncbi:rhodanese-like domain-containing protein [bacterium]|nr:rhodanese-like domain-containing protein [bacterium]